MSSYLNVNELAESPAFRGRLQAGIAIKAAAVLAEDDLPPGQAAKRQQLARDVLEAPAAKVNAFVWLVVTNGQVRENGMDVADADLEWVIGWAWDQVAGVNDTDKGPEAAQS